jgi:hypothetical protein
MGVVHPQPNLVERSALAEQVNAGQLPPDPPSAGWRMRLQVKRTYINESQNVRSSCMSEAGFSMEKTWSIG